MHLDLQRVIADQVIRINVPIHYINGDLAPGVKLEGGSVSTLLNEVEVGFFTFREIDRCFDLLICWSGFIFVGGSFARHDFSAVRFLENVGSILNKHSLNLGEACHLY